MAAARPHPRATIQPTLIPTSLAESGEAAAAELSADQRAELERLAVLGRAVMGVDNGDAVVAVDEEDGPFVEGGLDRGHQPFAATLAPAADSGVGFDLQKQPGFAGAGDECPGVRVFERLAGRDAEFVGFSGGNFHIAYTTWVRGADIVPFRQDAGKQKELL